VLPKECSLEFIPIRYVFITGRSLTELQGNANNYISKLHKWLIANEFHLNIYVENTCYYVFFPIKSPHKSSSLKLLNDVIIKHVNSCKYLCVLTDD